MDEAQERIEEHSDDQKEDITPAFTMKAREAISSRVRYKSHDMFKHKDLSAGEGDPELLVRGVFTTDTVDEVGDIITKEATIGAVEDWRKWGNIRTMHSTPSGRVEAIGEGDGLKWNEVVTVPVDKGTIDLIKGGVLKAYSVGIIPREYELNQAAMEDNDDPWFFPLIIHSYDMIEISYVDHPANYSATISEVSEGKDIGSRVPVFKRLPDEILEVESVDKEAEGVSAETEEIVEEAVIEEEVESNLDADLEEELTADIDQIEEIDEDNVPEGEVESDYTFKDVMEAVHDIPSQVEHFFEVLYDSLPAIVSDAIELALSATEQPDVEVVDGGDDAESGKEAPSVDVVKLIEEFRIEVIDKIEAISKASPARHSLLTVEDDDDGDIEEDETGVEKTKRWLSASHQERRSAMKEMLRGK